MAFDVKVRERILRPVEKVFDAVIDPAKMSNYFISSASGPIEEGRKVTWTFADVGAKVNIDIVKVRKNSEIIYESSAIGQPLRTTITFASDGADTTVVTIIDSSFELNEGGVKLALGQNAGWTYTLCGLKAYLQFGINLRAGLNKRLTDVQLRSLIVDGSALISELAIGAAGRIGAYVVSAIAKRGAPTRGFVHKPEHVDRARSQGVAEVRDLHNQKKLDTAFKGILSPAFIPDEADLGRSVVDAAIRARIRRFVFSAVIHPILSVLSNHTAKAAVEDANWSGSYAAAGLSELW